MEEIFNDLHIHSTASDGKLTPEEIVDWAVKKKIKNIAITDHDIIEGSKKAVEYAKDKNINVISGVEFSVTNKNINLENVHIVGLFIDLNDKKINNLVDFYLKARELQKKDILKQLKIYGYDISFEELKEESGSLNFGRPHIARILLKKYPNDFKDINTIFDKYLANPKTVYVEQKMLNMKEIIKIIHNAGGIAILAHPGLYKNYNKIIEKFVEFEGDGIEVNYSYIKRTFSKEKSENIIKIIKKIANKYNLIISGGTDFHDMTYPEIGSIGVSDDEFENIINYKTNI